MDPLLSSISQNVADDVRELVKSTHLQAPGLTQLDPPNFHGEWHLPLGFLSLAAAGAILVAAGGVQTEVQERRHGTRHPQTRMHRGKITSRPLLGQLAG